MCFQPKLHPSLIFKEVKNESEKAKKRLVFCTNSHKLLGHVRVRIACYTVYVDTASVLCTVYVHVLPYF